MTPRKIIQRLIDIADDAGPAIQEAAGVPDGIGACVLMTAIGCDVLATLGVRAEPFPVASAAMNAAYVAWAAAGSPGGRAGMPADAYCLADLRTVDEVDIDRIARPPSSHQVLDGRLVVHLPGQEMLLDLEMRQFHRPEKGLVGPGAAGLSWPAGTQMGGWALGAGGRLQFTARPDYHHHRKSLWWIQDRKRFVPAIARAIRKGERLPRPTRL